MMDSLNAPVLFLMNSWRRCKKNIQQGLSLIEAAMVMALSAIVIAGVVAYYQSAADNQKAEATVAMLTSLISVIHSTYASQPDYTGIKAEVIGKTGALPASMVNKDGMLVTLSGEIIDIKQGGYHKSREGNPIYFGIRFPILKSLCAQLARLDLGSSLAGFAVGPVELNPTFQEKPLTVQDSQALCNDEKRLDKENPGMVQMRYDFQ